MAPLVLHKLGEQYGLQQVWEGEVDCEWQALCSYSSGRGRKKDA